MIKSGDLVHLLSEWTVKRHKLSLLYAQRKVTPRKLVTFNLAVKEWLESSQLYLIQRESPASASTKA